MVGDASKVAVESSRGQRKLQRSPPTMSRVGVLSLMVSMGVVGGSG